MRSPGTILSNGWTLIEQHDEVVLALDSSGDSAHPFATWRIDERGATYGGEYYSELFDAFADYQLRSGAYRRV